jgi:Sulfotransferase domain
VVTVARVLPDFVIIGGSKSGTNWLNECLSDHPEVYLTPDVAEIFFFDRYFDRGIDWYAHYFRGYRGQRRVGDVTPTYLADPLAPERLQSVLPHATLIVSMRNPIERARSKYLHMWRKGDVPGRTSFWEACNLAPEILGDGEYFRCLGAWRRLFPPEQLHLLVLDDAATGPFDFLRSIYEILDVDPSFQAPKATEKTNEHQTPRSLLAAKLAFHMGRSLHAAGFHSVVDFSKRLGIKRVVLKDRRDETKEPPPFTDEDRAVLARHYHDDVAALSELVGRDLVKLWLT